MPNDTSLDSLEVADVVRLQGRTPTILASVSLTYDNISFTYLYTIPIEEYLYFVGEHENVSTSCNTPYLV